MKWKAKERTVVYDSLRYIHNGFEGVRAGLERLTKIRGFDCSELVAFREQCEEVRASTLSYLTEVTSESETENAADLQRRRFAREKRAG